MVLGPSLNGAGNPALAFFGFPQVDQEHVGVFQLHGHRGRGKIFNARLRLGDQVRPRPRDHVHDLVSTSADSDPAPTGQAMGQPITRIHISCNVFACVSVILHPL